MHDMQYTTNNCNNGQWQREKKRKIDIIITALGYKTSKTDQRHVIHYRYN